MAQGIRLVCENCSKAIEAWDDGNPYYLDRRGRKKYAYHPDPKRERCTGNVSRIFVLTAARSSWPIQTRRMNIVSSVNRRTSWTLLVWPGIDVLSANLECSLRIQTFLHFLTWSERRDTIVIRPSGVTTVTNDPEAREHFARARFRASEAA